MSWETHLRALAASWMLVVGLFLVAALGAYVVSSSRESRYEATTRVALATSPSVTDPLSQIEAVQNLNQGSLLPTLAAIYSADSSGDTIGDVPIPRGYRVTSVILQQSNVVDVLVDGPDARRAAELADQFAFTGGRQFADVYPSYQVNTVHTATVPTARISPSPRRDAAISGIVGLGLAYLLALGLYRYRERQRSADAASPPVPHVAATQLGLEPVAISSAAEPEPVPEPENPAEPEPPAKQPMTVISPEVNEAETPSAPPEPGVPVEPDRLWTPTSANADLGEPVPKRAATKPTRVAAKRSAVRANRSRVKSVDAHRTGKGTRADGSGDGAPLPSTDANKSPWKPSATKGKRTKGKAQPPPPGSDV